MNKHYSHINTANEILKRYKGEEPFAFFLKKFFSSNKKYGSKDRRQISHLCYCFFRLGKMELNITVEEKILAALFLCSDTPNEMLASLNPEWNEKTVFPVQEKLLIINYSPKESLRTLLIKDVFPWKNELSEGMDHEGFCKSFFIQPDLFIRLRPGSKELVLKKLKEAEIGFKVISDSCIALPNSSKIDRIVELDKEAVIQDMNSQRAGSFIPVRPGRSDRVWDCCAGSGGKSIMAYDINPNIQLTVSDVRESILVNLKKRFDRAGIKTYKSFVADLSSNKPKIPNPKSEIIICDTPCSGSGTWSRTPEQLYFFNEKEIDRYSTLQKKIVSNVIPQLQNGGSFIYLTCSVFKKENGDVVEYIKENFHLEVTQIEILKGYDKKADSMFVAVLKKL